MSGCYGGFPYGLGYPLLVPQAPQTLGGLDASLADVAPSDTGVDTTLEAAIGGRIKRSGDTMLGRLTLAFDPVLNLDPATKQYVDAAAASAALGVPPGGSIGGLSGRLSFAPDAVTFNQILEDSYLLRSYGVMADGVSDDTAAMQLLFTDWPAITGGQPLQLPGLSYHISAPLSVVIPDGNAFILKSAGTHGARFIVTGAFTGDVLTVNYLGSAAPATGPSAHIESITFARRAGQGGRALVVNSFPGGMQAPSPGLVIERVNVLGDAGNGWAGGVSLFGTNQSRMRNCQITGLLSTSVGLRIDGAPAQQVVDLDFIDVDVRGYTGGGSVGVQIGHTGGTALIQGLTFERLGASSVDYGLRWDAATFPAQAVAGGAYQGSIQISNSQFDGAEAGPSHIVLNNASNPIITDSIFLAAKVCSIVIQGGYQAVIEGNVFYGGSAQPTGTQSAILLSDLGGGAGGGNLVTGNLFTAYLGGLANNALILTTGSTQCTFIDGNFALNQPLHASNASGVQNYYGTNIDDGVLQSGLASLIGNLNVVGTVTAAALMLTGAETDEGGLTVDGPVNAVGGFVAVGNPAAAGVASIPFFTSGNPAYYDVQILASGGGGGAGRGVLTVTATTLVVSNFLQLNNLPVSPAGLTAGTVWKDAANGNVLKAV